MNHALEVPYRVRQALASAFSETLAKLSGGGMRLALEVPDEIRARQNVWPEDAPLSEAELRGELQAMLETARAMRERARELFERLPKASAEEVYYEVPRSHYCVLACALYFAVDEGLEEFVSFLQDSLGATAESLRREWLGLQLRNGLDPLSGPEANELLAILVEALYGAPGQEPHDVEQCEEGGL